MSNRQMIIAAGKSPFENSATTTPDPRAIPKPARLFAVPAQMLERCICEVNEDYPQTEFPDEWTSSNEIDALPNKNFGNLPPQSVKSSPPIRILIAEDHAVVRWQDRCHHRRRGRYAGGRSGKGRTTGSGTLLATPAGCRADGLAMPARWRCRHYSNPS